MKLEVGMYVRTKHCGLFKILDIIEENGSTKLLKKPGVVVEVENKKYKCYLEEEILKASHNIIDLIEVGDYVNGAMVYEIKEGCVMIGFESTILDEDYLAQTVYKNEIKSIVTKEQFEAMKYEIK